MTNEQREYCKEHLTSYVESITERSRGSRNQYNCPLCGSGTGRKRTGAFSIDTQKNRYKCFACDAGGDVFDLIAAVEHLEPNSREVFKRAEELFNVTVTDTAPPPMNVERKKDNTMEVVEMTTEQIAKNKYLIEKGQKRAFEYDYYINRGLTAETIEKYQLGIIDNYSFTTKDGKRTPDLGTAAIIPYPNEDYFVARLLDPPGDWSKYVYRAGQPRPRLFNGDALYSDGSDSVIVVEGQLDCLSVLEVGAEAIGLGSATNYRGLLKQLEEKPTAKTLILALDNDETGEKFIRELKKG